VSAWCCQGRAPCLIACASCASRACWRRCSKRPPRSRCLACVSACRCCSITAPKARPGVGTPGLGLIHGEVLKFELAGQLQPDGSRYKVPQMGWNQVYHNNHGGAPHPVWGDVPDGSYFYFVHSFYAQPSDARHSIGETDYGGRFSSAIARDNIFATQFHPEKSAGHGLALYRNFLHWNP